MVTRSCSGAGPRSGLEAARWRSPRRSAVVARRHTIPKVTSRSRRPASRARLVAAAAPAAVTRAVPARPVRAGAARRKVVARAWILHPSTPSASLKTCHRPASSAIHSGPTPVVTAAAATPSSTTPKGGAAMRRFTAPFVCRQGSGSKVLSVVTSRVMVARPVTCAWSGSAPVSVAPNSANSESLVNARTGSSAEISTWPATEFAAEYHATRRGSSRLARLDELPGLGSGLRLPQ